MSHSEETHKKSALDNPLIGVPVVIGGIAAVFALHFGAEVLGETMTQTGIPGGTVVKGAGKFLAHVLEEEIQHL
jgi:hypothetical protein